ncbi:hypothetical protein CEXT_296611 [Caerostris extrusa]|uniref:Uncharacterized protein n=1 Tax=Caerostris extrusa TaxID=172846 RepID=A0AAV4UPL4_CAEEX|nr:hypothetical protein CEXT_296611 [Caerostris extrusa]
MGMDQKRVRQRIKVIDSMEEKTNAIHQAIRDIRQLIIYTVRVKHVGNYLKIKTKQLKEGKKKKMGMDKKKRVRQRIKVMDSVEEKSSHSRYQAANYLHYESQTYRQLSENQDKAAEVSKSISLKLRNLNRSQGSL